MHREIDGRPHGRHGGRGYADSTIASGTTVQVRATAKTFSDIHTLLHGIEVLSETSITGTTTISTAASSFNKSYVCSGTSANYAVTLPVITGGAFEGMTLSLRMSTALTKLVTVTAASGETVGGTATKIMWAGEEANLVARGTDWVKQSGVSRPIASFLSLAGQDITVALATWTYIALDTVNSGPAFALVGSDFVCPRPGFYAATSGCYVDGNVTGGYITSAVNQSNPPMPHAPACASGVMYGQGSYGQNCAAGDRWNPAVYVFAQSSAATIKVESLSVVPARIYVVETPTW